MRDIGFVLNHIMSEEKCSPIHALFILSEKGQYNELYKLQPEPCEKTCGGLCDSCDCKNSK